ncbi:MAG TPA: hypothetical protein VFG07_07825 [Thermoplasmata archaeon]|nr:hypothetical protein [Thermoplasmata archaeon]
MGRKGFQQRVDPESTATLVPTLGGLWRRSSTSKTGVSPRAPYQLPRFDWAPRLAIPVSLVVVAVMIVWPLFPTQVSTGTTVAGSRFSVAGATPTAQSLAAAGLTLGIGTQPSSICLQGVLACSAGTDTSRVTLTATAGGQGQLVWPAVQVAFVVETTLYDGVYDPGAGEPGNDICSGTSQAACEESNGVPFFVANAQQIASAISAANPHTKVSFAMVDYFATLNNWDDGDGAEYHVDIPQFISSTDFSSAVTSTFKQSVLAGTWHYSDSDFADNILHSSSITALYGTIIGSGLDWSNDTHHVIVWMGSTAPRDPAYPVNYCVSASQYMVYGHSWGCIGDTCEPSYHFPSAQSPNCEGWVRSVDGNATHSIAQLAHTAKQCTESIGGVCTIDTIDYWTTPTDPYSAGWPTKFTNVGGGAGGIQVFSNVAHIIEAGCDLAHATGGTWDGPAFASCPDGTTGTLQYVPHGPYTSPNTANPSLFQAIRQIGFGPVLETQVAAGTAKPLFTFVPIGNIALSPNLQPTAACERAGETFHSCQTTPTVVHKYGLTYLGWNWSTNKSANVMYIGDSWTASFNVVAGGPPFGTVPVDACITTDCKAFGSGAVLGFYTSASFVPADNKTVETDSFPLGTVRVVATPAELSGVAPPPPPPAPPPFAIPTAPPLPVIQQIGVGNSVGVANVSLQAAAAGFLGAGFMRVTIRNRPIAMKVAAKAGSFQSKFDSGAMKKESSIGRFE